MTTPNYPYNDDSGSQNPFNDAPYGANQPGPYDSSYTGGFENSPLNSAKNTAATWALGLGIASLVSLLAVFTVVGAFLALLAPAFALAGIIVAIVALVKAKKINGPGKRKGFAITGLILSILTLVVLIGITIIAVTLFANSGLVECANLPDAAAQQQCVEDIINGY
ncbi:DUF4190 domain-containing protein [Corynebacterium crudilactis]|uniref:DUF4190 domain-containing protein n=1 Tax=Corynebacterium crudilactis TaxID=1652495 RepID=A0A172QU65_9CORY|nr:DUF4190 domain-containing protein [Corynebacterium crudilactis]ANE04191.1 hypothetical protein ccrud_08240 [Corynebacterium crudilactis]